MTDEQIREIFMAHGFTIEEGQTDLKPYIYAAARALLSASKPAVEPWLQAEIDFEQQRRAEIVAAHDRAANAEHHTSPAAPAQSGEPVAWVYDFRSSLNVGWKEEFSRLPPTQSEWVRNIVPLLPYAAPQPAHTAQSGEPVAWQVHPFDYGVGSEGVYARTDRPDQVEAWKRKGWRVTSLYAAPQPAQTAQSAVVLDDERAAFDVALAALDDYQRYWDTGLPAEYAQSERIAMECAVEAVREALKEARAASPQTGNT